MRVITYHLFVLLVSGLAFSEDILGRGYEVFKRSCSTCHRETMTPQELAEVRDTVMKGGKPPIKAPPMSEVSARVKKFYPTEEEFVKFVKDYITNPSREKSVCLPRALKLFGVMPPVGRVLSDEEREAVARWLFHRFSDTWEEFIKKHPH